MKIIKAECGCNLAISPILTFNIICDEHTAWEVYGDYADVNGKFLDSLIEESER